MHLVEQEHLFRPGHMSLLPVYTRITENRIGHVKLHVLTFSAPSCEMYSQCPPKAMFLSSICFVGSKYFIDVICTYLHMLVSNKIYISKVQAWFVVGFVLHLRSVLWFVDKY